MNFRLNTALIASLALVLAACSDDEFTGEPQVRPQLPTMPIDGIALAQGDGATQAINLGTLVADNTPVKLADITEVKDFPSSEYNLVFKMEVAKDASFANAKEVETEVVDNAVYVPSAQLQDIVTEVITKDPRNVVDLYARLAPYAENDAASVRLGADDQWFSYVYKIKPAQPYTIDDSYYIVGNFNNWTASDEYKFTHSATNVYDDPLFAYVLEVDEALGNAGVEWKLLPGAYYGKADAADHFLGIEPSEKNPAEGTLVAAPGANSTLAGTFSGEGRRLISVNMHDLTSMVVYAFDRLWAPGAGSSTSNFDKVQQLFTTDFINFKGMAVLRGNWWLTGQASIKGVNFVEKAETTPKEDEKTGTISGEIESSSANTPKMKVPTTRALYYVTANLSLYTYAITPITTINLVGAFNGWTADHTDDAATTALTPSSDCLTWTITDFTLTEASELKLNANNGWDINFGRKDSNDFAWLDGGSGNYNLEPGTYDITINFATLSADNQYTLTIVKK